MPTRDPAPKGAPCWFDLSSSDTDKTRAFYGELFGWTAEDPNEEFGGYINFQRDGVRIAGCMANDGSMGPDGWSVYLATDDILKVAEAAPAAGGAVMMPPMAVGDLGQMAFLTDPGGAVVGAWQPGAHAGFTVVNEAGAPGWFELHTKAWKASLDFYRDVFGEEVQDVSVEEFHYAMFVAGDDQLAGVVDSSAWDDDPTGWFVYITVDSADDTAAKAVQLGGTVVQAPEDTPYGRLATLHDSTGATIKLLQNL
jgi:uncharacterized protein